MNQAPWTEVLERLRELVGKVGAIRSDLALTKWMLGAILLIAIVLTILIQP